MTHCVIADNIAWRMLDVNQMRTMASTSIERDTGTAVCYTACNRRSNTSHFEFQDATLAIRYGNPTSLRPIVAGSFHSC